MTKNRTTMAACAVLAGVAFGGAGFGPARAAPPDYFGAQLEFAYPENTHNNDNHEASSELMVSGQAFAGWHLAPWAAVQANLTLMRQFLHGFNHGTTRESNKGDRYAIAAMICPVLRLGHRPHRPAQGRAGAARRLWGRAADLRSLEPLPRRRLHAVGVFDVIDQLGASAALV